MNIRFAPNTLYYGDCLDIMADFPDSCIDLICLDPPFNSNEKYNKVFKDAGLRNIDPQIKAFDDMWLWDAESAERVRDIKNAVANPASKVIAAFEMMIPNSQMLSYTSYMAQRLFEMHRVLKDTGSIYLHCDPTASHYLKLIMDAIWGEKQFRNEIIWHHPKIGIAKKSGLLIRTQYFTILNLIITRFFHKETRNRMNWQLDGRTNSPIINSIIEKLRTFTTAPLNPKYVYLSKV